MTFEFNAALAAQQLARLEPDPVDITAQAHTPALVFEQPSSELQRELARLHAEVARYAAAHTQRVRDVTRDGEAAREAKAALDAEIARGAREARPNADLEADLALAYERAKAKATPEVHEPRVQLAYDAYISALGEYEGFVREHVEELVEELRSEAEEVAAEWQKAHEKARRLLDPVEEKHRQLHARVSVLAGYQQKIRRSLVPEGTTPFHPSHFETLELLTVPANAYGTPPVPTPEAIAEYAAHVRPTPVDVEAAA